MKSQMLTSQDEQVAANQVTQVEIPKPEGDYLRRVAVAISWILLLTLVIVKDH